MLKNATYHVLSTLTYILFITLNDVFVKETFIFFFRVVSTQICAPVLDAPRLKPRKK